MINKGFTLIELLFAIGILLLVVIATSNIFFTGRRTSENYEAGFQARETSKIAMDRISWELRLSRPGTMRINNNRGFILPEIHNGSVINFQIPVGAYSQNLTLNINNDLQWGSTDRAGDFIAYFVDGAGQLKRGIYTQPNAGDIVEQVVVPGISNITFDRDNTGSGLIRIKVITAMGAGNYTLSSEVILRNS